MHTPAAYIKCHTPDIVKIYAVIQNDRRSKFTADGVLYSGYILSEIEMDFNPDRMIGSLMIKLRGAE